MILLRTNLTRFFHFTKPALSTLTSLKDIETVLQKRLVAAIQATNTQTLQHYSLVDSIKQKLAVETDPAKTISQRTVNLSIINPRTLDHRTIEVSLSEGLSKNRLTPEQFGFPFQHPQDRLAHFSEHRGAPNFEELTEYQLDDKTLLLFNLPENITQQDIQVTVREPSSRVVIKYCVLGLPAYAKVQFGSAEDLSRCLGKLQNKKIEFGERISKLKSYKDSERLKLANRRLVIHIDETTKLQNMIIDLSKFGRVLHVDWPIEAYMSPTVEDVKQFYKGTKQLIKINKYEVNGNIESEYFPNMEVWRADQDERDIDNIVDKIDSMRESYENRTRFARNVDVYAGKEHQLILKNRGFCVATYSTSQECQNYYFSEGAKRKIELVGNRLEFQYDPLFKKEVLRQIDNQYLLGKKNDFGRKQQAQALKQKTLEEIIPNKKNVYTQKQSPEYYQSYYILQRLIMYRQRQEAKSKTSNYSGAFKYLQASNQFLEWQDHLTMMRQAKAEYETKTFDQLAEIQLYGRVLPKDKNIQRIKAESIKYKNTKQFDLINEYDLITNEKEFRAKNLFYQRQRVRNNRLTDQELGITVGSTQELQIPEEGEQIDAEEAPVREDTEQKIGKHSFSTTRPQFLYRKRGPEEIANYLRRYNQFLRTNIYEYMGVFHDKLVEEAIISKPDVLNLQSLKFLDGSPFLTQDQILEVLQFRRDFNSAQQDYENYVYGSQFVKSSGLNITSLQANFIQSRIQAIRQLVDVGVVEETRKVQGNEEDLKAKVKILNAEAAGFGQEYRIQNHNDSNYLLKIRKLQHLAPIDRIAHLQKVVQEIDSSITIQQAALFQIYYKQMKQTGVIPDEVRKAFEIEQQISVAELMSQMGVVYNVSKKDLQIAERIRSYSKQQINQDINTQYTIESIRKKKRKIGSSDFAKDPSEIYVKDREGYFKVSRYRQI